MYIWEVFRLSWPEMCCISLALAPSSELAGRHRVAQGVHQCSHGDPGADAGPAVRLADQVLGSSPPDALAVAVDEEGRGGRELPVGARGLAGGEVVVDDELEWGLDRHEADLGALAGDFEAPLALPAVDGAQVQVPAVPRGGAL
jgi:hypothetical protein